MDPNANLDEQLLLAARLQQLAELNERRNLTPAEHRELRDSAARLGELVEALNRWLAGGGFLPDAWRMPCPVCRQPALVLLTEGEPGHEHRELVCEACAKPFIQVFDIITRR